MQTQTIEQTSKRLKGHILLAAAALLLGIVFVFLGKFRDKGIA
jgi:hypothetical protein